MRNRMLAWIVIGGISALIVLGWYTVQYARFVH